MTGNRPTVNTAGIDHHADPQRFRDPVADFVEGRLTWKGAAVLGVLVFGVGEKLLLPAIQGYLNLSGELSSWRPDVEALVNGFVLVPSILAAYVWQINGVHEVWVEFARSRSFENKQGFQDYMRNAEKWFQRPWWVVAVVVAVIGVIIQGLWLWNPENPLPVEPWWTEGEPLARWVALGLALPGWYAAVQIVFGQARLAASLRKLWKKLGDSYKLGSKGRTGGVASLSKNVAIMATVGAVVLLNIVLGLLLPQMRAETATPDFFLWAVVIWTAYLLVVPGIVLALLWPAHVVMDEKRGKRIAAIVESIDARFESAEQAVTNPGEGRDKVEDLANLRRLRDWLEEDLPSWPLPAPLRAISWSTVVPILLTVLTVVLERLGS